MSEAGIKKAAMIFSQLQAVRVELLQMGIKANDKQDILLGRMLEDGKNVMKEKFAKLTLRR